MPVQRSALGKRVIENDPYAIALRDLNGRPGATAVVAPDIDGLEWRDFSLQRLRFQAEHLHPVVHFERQIRNVRRDHGHGFLRRRFWAASPTIRLFLLAPRLPGGRTRV